AGGRLRERLGDGWVVLAPRPAGDAVVIGERTAYGDERAWLVRPDGYLADSAPLSSADSLQPPFVDAAGRGPARP
ncbi:MAG TPA: hypothetical protein VFW95_00095, partial [Candidatus Limnocylindria bacterium]|nr:hypothetical protein [Candidatus Limnocylindria bacterium]